MRTTSQQLTAMMTALVMSTPVQLVRRPERQMLKKVVVRPCSNCGKPKVHNNSFCSAECCREYKAKQKESKRD